MSIENSFAIELRNFKAGYGNKAVLKNVNLNVKQGEFVSILGENGAGKTTLFKAILQLIPVIDGEVKILGKDVTKGKDKQWLRTKIGYVPQKQNYGKFPISVFDAVLLGRWGTSFSYLKRPSKEDEQIVSKTLEIVDLQNMQEKDCSELSGGQIQRLNIARSIVRKPKILLLDEPATYLDMESQIKLNETIKIIRKQYNISILMISHDKIHAEYLSDRILFLTNGEMIKNME